MKLGTSTNSIPDKLPPLRKGITVKFNDYDKENKPLGITDVDINNFCTYSYPYLRRMKWGSLTERASEELKNLITE